MEEDTNTEQKIVLEGQTGTIEGVATRRPGKTLSGKVLSAKMQESAIVLVTNFVKHARYGKYIRRRKKYLVHNPENKHAPGESVTIASCRPLSKRKHFIIV
jgi:small subunit ribosomal protein S17